MTGEAVIRATEAIVSLSPFTVRRTVRWSECDPAGVVYAGKFPDYMVNAGHLFRDYVLRAPVGRQPAKTYDTPGKALNIVFLGPLWPRDIFEMSVHVGGIGRHTTHMLVMARRFDTGAPIFAGRISSIYVDPADRLTAIPVPDEIRSRLRAYQETSGPRPAELDQVAL